MSADQRAWFERPVVGASRLSETLYLGGDLSLDIVNDGVNTTTCLAQTGNYSGQYLVGN